MPLLATNDHRKQQFDQYFLLQWPFNKNFLVPEPSDESSRKKVGDLKKMLGKPDLFKLKELNAIAFFCGLNGEQVHHLVQEHEKLLKSGRITWEGKKLDKRHKPPITS